MISPSSLSIARCFIAALTSMLLCYETAGPLYAQTGSLLHAQPNPAITGIGPRARAQLPNPQQIPQWMPNETVPLDEVGNADRTGQRTDGGGAAAHPNVMLNQVSWTHQPAPQTRTFRRNDIVTIRVDEITRMAAEGTADSRKQTLFVAALTDWIRLSKFQLFPDPQTNGDPTIGTQSNGQYRAQSAIESRESMAFNIAAKIVDVRPNGNMLLEARKTIRVNDNLWETSLTGLCRAADITADNVILSKDLIDLEIKKEDRGHLRDGYARGWLQRFMDRFQPF